MEIIHHVMILNKTMRICDQKQFVHIFESHITPSFKNIPENLTNEQYECIVIAYGKVLEHVLNCAFDQCIVDIIHARIKHFSKQITKCICT